MTSALSLTLDTWYRGQKALAVITEFSGNPRCFREPIEGFVQSRSEQIRCPLSLQLRYIKIIIIVHAWHSQDIMDVVLAGIS